MSRTASITTVRVTIYTSSATGRPSLDMPPASYDPLSQGDSQRTDEPVPGAGVNGYSVVPPRPLTYYEEGPFDPPSSEDEEDALLEKSPRSPGSAERGVILEEQTPDVGPSDIRRKACLHADHSQSSESDPDNLCRGGHLSDCSSYYWLSSCCLQLQ